MQKSSPKWALHTTCALINHPGAVNAVSSCCCGASRLASSTNGALGGIRWHRDTLCYSLAIHWPNIAQAITWRKCYSSDIAERDKRCFVTQKTKVGRDAKISEFWRTWWDHYRTDSTWRLSCSEIFIACSEVIWVAWVNRCEYFCIILVLTVSIKCNGILSRPIWDRRTINKNNVDFAVFHALILGGSVWSRCECNSVEYI